MAEGVDGVKLWGVNEVKEDYSLFSLEFSLSRGTGDDDNNKIVSTMREF